jgi:hypothetical protein
VDNIVGAQVALANLDDTAEGGLNIQYAKALVAKALEQQYVAQDSQGRFYSHSSASRAASSAAHSTNNPVDPHPLRAMVAANGQPIDARTHIMNDQAWRERNCLDANFRHEQPRQSAFSRVGPSCFGPSDLTVFIDSYTMVMGILGYFDLLAARYLPLMMDGVNRQWFNTLPPNSIDSWEATRAAFIQHFASAYTRATTIEDVDRCIQGPRKSTRR